MLCDKQDVVVGVRGLPPPGDGAASPHHIDSSDEKEA